MKNFIKKERQHITKYRSVLGIEKRRRQMVMTRIKYKSSIFDAWFFFGSDMIMEIFNMAKKGTLEDVYHWKNGRDSQDFRIPIFITDSFKSVLLELSKRHFYHALNELRRTLEPIINISKEEFESICNASYSKDKNNGIYRKTLNYDNIAVELGYRYNPEGYLILTLSIE